MKNQQRDCINNQKLFTHTQKSLGQEGIIGSVQFSSFVQSCPTLCNPMDCSTPGSPVHQQLLELAQTHVHWVGHRWWCHLTISSSVVTFSFCLSSFPTPGSFPMSQFFASSGHCIGASASTSALPINIQDWFHLGWTRWISLQWLSRVFSNTTLKSISFLAWSFPYQFFWPSQPYMITGKTIGWPDGPLLAK